MGPKERTTTTSGEGNSSRLIDTTRLQAKRRDAKRPDAIWWSLRDPIDEVTCSLSRLMKR